MQIGFCLQRHGDLMYYSVYYTRWVNVLLITIKVVSLAHLCTCTCTYAYGDLQVCVLGTFLFSKCNHITLQ